MRFDLMGSFRGSERRWIVVAALVLLPVFFLPVLPVWTMKLWAPQYPEGLQLTIYAHTIKGDLQKINTLNHYVGMHQIRPDDFDEFRYMPQLLTFFGFMALLAALVNRRWLAVLGWLAFTGFAVYMFRDYANWLWSYGHDLDPRAAIKLDAFTPPLIGYKKMANFKVWSLPGPGTILLGFAWLLGPAVLLMERRAARKRAMPVAEAMRLKRGTVLWLGVVILAAAAAAVWSTSAEAATRLVPPRAGAAAAAIAAASAGDVILLQRGVHAGPLRIDRPLTLRGAEGAILDGRGQGSVLEIAASRVTVENLAIRRSGNEVNTGDAAVRVSGGTGVVLRRISARDVLYGIYVERAESLTVAESHLTGRVRPLDESGFGNGIHLWYSHDALLRGNTVERFTDAIYLSFANRTRVIGNRLQENGRYGLHTMYCQESQLERNRFAWNVAGCAIMFSNGLRVTNNDFVHNRGSRTYGLLLRDCSAGTFTGNRFSDNTIAVFMDNSNRNVIRENLVQDNGWGLFIFSSCAGNETTRNLFINNDYPVALDMRRSDNRFDDGTHGNFWSENAPYDLDADGVSDVPYSPVSAFAFISKQYPDLALLAKSPAVAAITVAERVFPALRPSEIVDGRPFVSPASAAGGERFGSGMEDDALPEAVRARIEWTAAAGFAGLMFAGFLGMIWGRNGR
jgi:nitrous oxidase accessory protein